MGLFDFADDLFSSDLLSTGLDLLTGPGSTGGNLGGYSTGSTLTTGVPMTYQTYMPQYSFPTPAPMMEPPPMATPVAAAGVPMVPRWSYRFPNLWQYLRSKFPFTSPQKVLSSMLGLLNRFGPTALTSFVGAAVVSELLSYKMTHKRRRMNPANSKALRRSMRRLKAFSRMSHRVEMQLGRSRGRRKGAACRTCRKNPCCC